MDNLLDLGIKNQRDSLDTMTVWGRVLSCQDRSALEPLQDRCICNQRGNPRTHCLLQICLDISLEGITEVDGLMQPTFGPAELQCR